VRANLARFKVPRDVTFVEEIPRNATDKVVRGRLPR
jgi:fatty-acyl-CoA synthase